MEDFLGSLPTSLAAQVGTSHYGQKCSRRCALDLTQSKGPVGKHFGSSGPRLAFA